MSALIGAVPTPQSDARRVDRPDAGHHRRRLGASLVHAAPPTCSRSMIAVLYPAAAIAIASGFSPCPAPMMAAS